MRSPSRPTSPVLPALLLASFLLLSASSCFNDAFRGHDYQGELDTSRFELVIESDRTAIDGSHFLVDRATGDLWVLDARSGSVAGWLRLAEGPADVKPLPGPPAAQPKDQDEQDEQAEGD